ncbi:anti-sigma factor family protein [Amycolatopsis sp. CA-126428]|uniref:anti-sigma factor family protein n=1 Tax=Amycolatopsis sp. CA-126428 TaxID=2073158 RepID=UPI000CD275D4|nr:zf-HC2 domain-containing protein [Amycolatopsis sp. CA-126428]
MTADPYLTWDAAYVLGLLDEANRLEFEDHLRGCDDCARRLSTLSDTPRLLDVAPLELFLVEEPDDLRPARRDQLPADLVAQMRATGRRRSWTRRAAAGLAMAAAVALGAVLGSVVVSRPGEEQSLPVSQATNAVIAAQLSVSAHDSWDQVDLRCTYTSQQFIQGNYVAVAVDRTGRKEVVGTWPPIPGQTATIRTPTTFRSGSITMVSIQDAQGRTVAQLGV